MDMIVKNRATYDLNSIKMAFNHPSKLVMTTSAKQGQVMLNFTDEDVVATIQHLVPSDFYKSMPPIHAHFTAWQDVYKTQFKGINLYIKFQINENRELILSFKEK
jgi:hypothetical protein